MISYEILERVLESNKKENTELLNDISIEQEDKDNRCEEIEEERYNNSSSYEYNKEY